MTEAGNELSTGLAGLDRVLKGLMPGDNVVWQADVIEDYARFVKPYWDDARAQRRRRVYFRFAKHPPLVEEDGDAEVYALRSELGFETFIGEIHAVIERTDRGAFYLFDCLSDLAADWYSDEMLGNFFLLTCPYLYDVSAVAYFAILRNHHSFHATAPIAKTAQVLLDVYRHKGGLYVHPIKVQQRHSPTMYGLHACADDTVTPVADSATIAEVLTSVTWSRLESADTRYGIWSRTFAYAEELLDAMRRGIPPGDDFNPFFRRLLRMVISRDERVQRLAERYLNLADIVAIRKRMIGTGLIGGKAVGMLVARAILRQAGPRWNDVLEPHDSFYIGSDVFYTFIVRNGCWWVRERRRRPDVFLEGAVRARQQMLRGDFSEHIKTEFADMLDYFGQSPIIVRSSSLLEDNFGNAFAGKYESVFCVNQGSRDKRLEDFLSAVRTVYASTMSDKALSYRARRGLLDRDEQMALLVQRVSGTLHGRLFYPAVAGVGLSFNPYVWNKDIDPEAGMVRLVFGLGTRAVDPADDDYTRVVALNAPTKRPEAGFDEVKQYTQRRTDLLDLEANQLVSRNFTEVAMGSPELPIELLASRDAARLQTAAEQKAKDVFPWVLTFEPLLSSTRFADDMRDMLQTLQAAYNHPVDVEFTANLRAPAGYRISLVQCRPLQVKGEGATVPLPAHAGPQDLVLRARGAVIGHGRVCPMDRVIYVAPSRYDALPIHDRYSVARTIGRIVQAKETTPPQTVMLLGPGRWGTTMPSLGVPVSFAEISSVTALCEIVAMRESLVPDVSLGTHFFNDLVETDILYFALFPGQSGNQLSARFFEQAANALPRLLPADAAWADVVRVIDLQEAAPGSALWLKADTLEQTVTGYLLQHAASHIPDCQDVPGQPEQTGTLPVWPGLPA